jgi:hypothetical protein
MRISCAHEAKSEVVIVSPVRSNGGGCIGHFSKRNR